jgi:hypothetical protein
MLTTVLLVCKQLIKRIVQFQGNMMCSLLNYGPAKSVSWGAGPLPFLPFAYDDVYCNGNESDLDKCAHVNVADCSNFEGILIACA